MKPSEILSRAIGQVRGTAAAATQGPWTARLENVNTYPQGGRDHWYAGDVTPNVVTGSEWPVCDVPNSRWIALMCPEITAPALEAWLTRALTAWQQAEREHREAGPRSPGPEKRVGPHDHLALNYARKLLKHADTHVPTSAQHADTKPTETPDSSRTPDATPEG